MSEEENGGFSVEEPVLDIPEFGLVINDEMRQAAAAITDTPFDPNLVFDRARLMHGTTPKAPTLDNAPGLLAEAHVAISLEKFVLDHPGVINLNPIPIGVMTELYEFERMPHRGTVAARLRETDRIVRVAEYDQVIEAGEVPAVLEVATGKKVEDVGKVEDIMERTAPLRAFFRKNRIGFVIIRPADAVGTPDEQQRNFENKNMVLAPLPLSRGDLREHAKNFVKIQ